MQLFSFHFSNARKWPLLFSSLLFAFLYLSGNVSAEELTGTWSGIATLEGQQGVMKLTIRRQGQRYAADYQGLPSFSGSLLNVRVGPGNRPNTTTFTAVSKSSLISSGNAARLRFYLLKEMSKHQLLGIMTLDRDVGKDMQFKILLERRPCCHGGCVLREGCP